MPRPMRPPPSISTEAIPRRASCAATIVPEKPPPIMATGAGRSDVIVGPLLRLARPGLDLLDILVGLGDDAAGGVSEQAGDQRVDEGSEPCANQLGADAERAGAVRDPAQPQRARMIDEQPAKHFASPFCPVFNILMVAPAGLEPATFGLGN